MLAELLARLETMRLDDVWKERAYNAATPFLRARLKTAIALQFALEGRAVPHSVRLQEDHGAGFCWQVEEKAAAWTLAVLDPAHAAPARLLAALVPAVLAGVEHIIVATLSAPPSPANSVALELAGLEDVFVLPDAEETLSALYTQHPDGRLLLFSSTDREHAAAFEALSRLARRLGLPLWQDRAAPRLLFLDEDDAERENAVRWAHGDAHIGRLTRDDDAMCSWDAVYPARTTPFPWATFSTEAIRPDSIRGERRQKSGPSPCVPLCPRVFGPGLEACWLPPDLESGFFRTRGLSAAFSPGRSAI